MTEVKYKLKFALLWVVLTIATSLEWISRKLWDLGHWFGHDVSAMIFPAAVKEGERRAAERIAARDIQP